MTDHALPSLLNPAFAPGVRLRVLIELLDRPDTLRALFVERALRTFREALSFPEG